MSALLVVHEPDAGVDLVAAAFTCTSEALQRLDPVATERAVRRLRETLTAHTADDGVWFNSRAWIVTARRCLTWTVGAVGN